MSKVERLTKTKVKSLRATGRRYEVWEGNGLGIRVSATGKKTWVFVYHFEGRSRRMTLGRYPTPLNVADAHEAHAKAVKVLDKGKDPGAKVVRERKEDREADTISSLVEEYLERWARPRKKSWKGDEQMLRREVLPQWRNRKAKSITRRDVIVLLDGIVDRGATVYVNRVLAVVRKMFNFAVSRDIVPFSPCTQVKAPAKENRRDRYLLEDEIRRLWNGLDGAAISPSIQLILKLTLTTAQRVGEVIAMEWADLDLKGKIWTIPAQKAKNNEPHRVPLSPLALGILKDAKTASLESQWVFPSPSADTHIALASVSQALRKNREVLNLEDVRPHDLRRTATTYLAQLPAVDRTLLSKILNHKDRGVTAIYDRYEREDEKRRALEAWATRLRSIIG